MTPVDMPNYPYPVPDFGDPTNIYLEIDFSIPSIDVESVIPDFDSHPLPTDDAKQEEELEGGRKDEREDELEDGPAGQAFDPEILARLEADPFTARSIDRLRVQTIEGLSTIVDQVSRLLAENAPSRPEAAFIGHAMNLRTLAAASRKGEAMGRQRRELAEALAVGGMINLDHPDWEPADASSSNQASNNILLALIQTPGSR